MPSVTFVTSRKTSRSRKGRSRSWSRLEAKNERLGLGENWKGLASASSRSRKKRSRLHPYSITTDLRDVLHWLPVQQRIGLLNIRSAYLSISAFTRQLHKYDLTEMCVPVSAIQRRCGLRSTVRGDLEVPRCNLARYGQRSFYISGPSLWISLPLTVRDSYMTLTQFCTRLKTFLFTRAYGSGHHHSASVTA